METNKLTAVHSRKLAYKLRQAGFKIIRVEPNRFEPQYNVWLFESTPEFESALSSLIVTMKGGARNAK